MEHKSTSTTKDPREKKYLPEAAGFSTAFHGDMYGTLMNPDRPKQTAVPNWLRDEIIIKRIVNPLMMKLLGRLIRQLTPKVSIHQDQLNKMKKRITKKLLGWLLLIRGKNVSLLRQWKLTTESQVMVNTMKGITRK